MATHWTGTNFEDYFEGSAEDDVADGLGRADTIYGRGGNDRLSGGVGADAIEGGTGLDRILGGPGSDHLSGNDGNDQIFGEADRDTLGGGAGNDLLYGNAGADSLSGGVGNDTLSGGGGGDFLFGGPGNDVLQGGDWIDEFEFVIERYQGVDNQNGRDIITDFDRLDRLVAISRSSGGAAQGPIETLRLSFELLDDNGSGRLGDGDRAAKIETVTFDGVSKASLVLDLVEAMNLPHSSAQKITLFGVTSLSPDAVGPFGSRVEEPFVGSNSAEFMSSNDDPQLVLALGGNDSVRGLGGEDQIDGGTGDDILDGGADGDLIHGGDGNDVIDGGVGDDFLFGDSGDDVVRGGDGGDELYGEAPGSVAGNDRIDGGPGEDRIYGGPGVDLQSGGDGADMFINRFGQNRLQEPDLRPSHVTILDFQPGQDIIGLELKDRIHVTFDSFDTNHDRQIDTHDRGTALLTREVDGVAEQGLLMDFSAVSGLGRIQEHEIFVVGISRLLPEDVVSTI